MAEVHDDPPPPQLTCTSPPPPTLETSPVTLDTPPPAILDTPPPPPAILDTQPPPPATLDTPPPPPPQFDPSRMIGIIRRKALIKDLAAAYHAECLSYCQELLELQRKSEESFIDVKVAEESRKEAMRPPKRLKKSR